MKYRPGDLCVVVRVPDVARGWVCAGDAATVLHSTALPEDAAPPDGLVKVKIKSFEFWWDENDMCLFSEDRTSSMTTWLRHHKEAARAAREPRGYDPYNSATTRPDVWRVERVTRVRLPPPRKP